MDRLSRPAGGPSPHAERRQNDEFCRLGKLCSTSPCGRLISSNCILYRVLPPLPRGIKSENIATPPSLEGSQFMISPDVITLQTPLLQKDLCPRLDCDSVIVPLSGLVPRYRRSGFTIYQLCWICSRRIFSWEWNTEIISRLSQRGTLQTVLFFTV